jgi:hypothetical protein
MEGSRGGQGEEVRTEPSRRREFLSWVGGISGKPLLIVIIDEENEEKFQGRIVYFYKLLWISSGRGNNLNFGLPMPITFA